MPGSTPTYGLPYPLPTEPIYQGAQRIRELAERLELILGALAGTNPPYEQVAMAAATVSIPNNASTSLVFDTRVSFNASLPAMLQPDGRMRVNQSGVYVWHQYVRFDVNATGRRDVSLHRERAGAGTFLYTTRTAALASVSQMVDAAGIDYFNAGDLISTRLLQNSGAALNVFGGTGRTDATTRMTLAWIRS